MKILKFTAILLITVGLIALGSVAVRSLFKRSDTVASATEANPRTKVDLRILRAQERIAKMPNKSDGYNELASAYMQKARETADFSFNASASDALDRSLAIEVDNYDGLKLRAKLQLTYHRFAEALETARRAQALRDDDHDVWGQITDAFVELGDYPAAVKSAQKMVDLRPDSSAYARISYLRSLHGDTYGAIQAMNAAVKAADPNDREGMAWCRVQLGNELMNAGKLQAAEAKFDEALRIFPDHRLALQAKARARIAVGDFQGAIRIYERAEGAAASADSAQALGELYKLLGREDQAKYWDQKFETLEKENAEIERSWRHMLNYWLDHDKNLQESLLLARREYELRKDIFTCDSLAWALFKNGNVSEAKKTISEALRTGSRDARINYHAGVIYRSLKMRDKAARYLRLGAAMNSAFDPVQNESAKKLLAGI
ncbi:MAG TPA: tetratricopeptide repeat protein [Pyrinomonadaceae bacterium]